ncbi:MAG: hypothetical protein VXB94_03140 [Rhodobiaceae bacterium]|jgi:uncharacterized metal-binding protein YceD (DUF177 family)
MKTFSLETLIDVETLPVKGPYRGALVADDAELAALSDRFGFVELGSLDVSVEIARVGPDTWDVKGRLQARLVQPCIVTGEPVPETVDFRIEERYVRATSEDEEVVVGLEDSEPLVDGCIELGEMVAQSLALAVNAWPRTVDAPDEFKAGDVEDPHPFASLGSLKMPGK